MELVAVLHHNPGLLLMQSPQQQHISWYKLTDEEPADTPYDSSMCRAVKASAVLPLTAVPLTVTICPAV